MLHLLLKRQLLSSDLVEPVEAKLSHLVAGDAEDLAYLSVGCIRCMVAISDEVTVLQLDDIVNL